MNLVSTTAVTFALALTFWCAVQLIGARLCIRDAASKRERERHEHLLEGFRDGLLLGVCLTLAWCHVLHVLAIALN